MVKLRPYQDEAVEAICNEFADGDSTLLVLPTGTGKTVVFARVLERHTRQRSIVIAHREELINQAVDKILRATNLDADVEMAGCYSYSGGFHKRSDVVVSSVQTQNAGCNGAGRMSRFTPNDFGMLVIDEAHHAPASSYRKVIDHYRQNPDLKLLGVTATPDRHDEEALGRIFGSVAMVYEINQAIRDGWLVPIRQHMVHVEGLDFSRVRTTAGDLNRADLARAMERAIRDEKPLHGIAGPTYEIANGRKTLVFAESVANAERLCEILNRHQTDCARWVCGKTPKDERRAMFRDYALGRFQILCNVGVATEGFDEPGIEVVVMARPTKSRALYAQMAGRGTRPLDGLVDPHEAAESRLHAIAESSKPYLEIVDFVGNAGRHKLMSTADILGGNYTDEVVRRATQRARAAGKPVDVAAELDRAEREIQEAGEKQRRRRVTADVTYQSRIIDPFDILDITPHRERGWDRGRAVSPRMDAVLRKAGINTKELSFARARQLVGEIFDRRDHGKCTYKQAKLLVRFGYSPDVTFEQASELISGLAANNWKRPKGAVA